jgi:hypothetical protein
MKPKARGLLLVLGVLFGIPLLADLLLVLFVPSKQGVISLTKFLSSGYLQMMPYYLLYLALALAVLFAIRKIKNKVRNKK